MTRRLILVLFAMVVTSSTLPVAAEMRLQTPMPTVDIAQRYTMDVSFDPITATIQGRLNVVWTNTTGVSQTSVPFRLYPNAEYYDEGALEIVGVQVDGMDVFAVGSNDDPTVTRVPIPETGTENQRTIGIDFSTRIPVDSDGSFGILRGNSADGSWTLASWYPIVAGWEPGEGWYLDPPTPTGDPTFPTTSSWDVSVVHPDALTLAGTGIERIVARTAGKTTTQISLQRGREFTMVAMLADQLVSAELDVEGVPVDIVLPADLALPDVQAALAQFTRDAVPRYRDWFDIGLGGELDLLNVDLNGALGVSWSGSIWFDLAPLVSDGQLDDAEWESLRFVVYHEIGHQWIANILGTNSNDYTFLTEGLVNVLAVAVVRDIDGGAAAKRAFLGGVAGPYRGFVNGGQDAVADLPIGQHSPVVHSIVTYGKGGLGFEAIRQQIGDDAFLDALTDLVETHAWDILTPDVVLQAFESASRHDLSALWERWFEEDGMTLNEVDAVIDAAGD